MTEAPFALPERARGLHKQFFLQSDAATRASLGKIPQAVQERRTGIKQRVPERLMMLLAGAAQGFRA